MLVDHAGDLGDLCVRAHHGAQQHDDEGGNGVDGKLVLRRRPQGLALRLVVGVLGICVGSFADRRVQQVPDVLGLDQHAAEAAAEEQDGDGEVLQVVCVPLAVVVAQVLQEDVGGAVEEDEEALGELG